ncbi:2-keto-3-deoxy-L-rhamnonate aldolase [Trifolium pratense]|uniref:Uncharacterized protein n=1 Tax=Trifolium pratense TaxID=57577 RepID=A0ACB0LXP9_TRIPR|nr:2-keto-3-deoxy-L-rhamnonate aldolase [Trifolium pratense]CAJ2674377.1 unnamed protein product [Trifolium pratense]
MANTTTISFTLTTPKSTTTFLSSLPTKSNLNFKLNPFTSSTHFKSIPNSSIPILKSFPDDTVITTTTPSYRNLKSRLRSGETLYGIFLLTFSPTLSEIAGLAGYDFVVVDMEHGHGSISDALPCLHALAASQTAAIVRVPETTAAWAKKALDLGPQGIMFPMIESGKSAAKAVSYCRFPPAGLRGSAHPIVRASSYGIDEGYLNNYLDELLVMVQVESEEGVKNVEKIAAVDGVDCVQMGPLDLSASMGYLWDPGNKKVKETLREAERKVLKRKSEKDDVFLSGFALPFDGPKDLRSRGYHMVSGASDVGLFRNSVVEDVLRFKESLVEDGSDSDREELGKDADEKYWSE